MVLGDMMKKVIRIATKSEYDYWFKLSTKLQAEDRAYVNQSNVSDELLKLKEMIPYLIPNGMDTEGHYFYVLEVDGNDVGFIWFGVIPNLPPHSIFLMDIIVRPEQRGQGFGGFLLDEMHLLLAKDGHKSVLLNVLKKNHARRLYESQGYKTIQTEEHNLLMIKEL